jgi:hypothetical protein
LSEAVAAGDAVATAEDAEAEDAEAAAAIEAADEAQRAAAAQKFSRYPALIAELVTIFAEAEEAD